VIPRLPALLRTHVFIQQRDIAFELRMLRSKTGVLTRAVSGFEIFDWTTFGQEASVPLETRRPGSFLLIYDDTGGFTTGVALSNVAAAANIMVNIYDDVGTLLQTTNLSLPAKGHTSFMLPDQYSQTANIRGMVEFVVPQGGGISAIGVRATPSGTLTTIPMLTR